MTERFGKCPRCDGKGYVRKEESKDGKTVIVEIDCMRCGGTGNDTDASTYYERNVL